MAKEREEGGRELQERGSPELRGASLVKLEGKADGPLQATSRMAAALCTTFWGPSEEGPGYLHSWCGHSFREASTPGDCVSQAEFRDWVQSLPGSREESGWLLSPDFKRRSCGGEETGRVDKRYK